MGDEWPWAPPEYTTWQDVFTEMNSLGRSQNDCAIFAAIAEAESSFDLTVLNNTPATGDYSVGAFQINYNGSLYAGRAAEFGTPEQLALGGLTKQCLAANAIGASSFTPWSTFNSGAYIQYLHGAVPPGGGGGAGGTPPQIQDGSTGPYVITLQQDLNVLGYGLAVDGDFGPLTLAAVEAFQRSQGIGVDGIVGPITWQHLANAVATAEGGASPGPTTIPGGSVPPSEPPGNADPATVGEWSNLVYVGGPELGSTLSNVAAYANAIGGFQ